MQQGSNDRPATSSRPSDWLACPAYWLALATHDAIFLGVFLFPVTDQLHCVVIKCFPFSKSYSIVPYHYRLVYEDVVQLPNESSIKLVLAVALLMLCHSCAFLWTIMLIFLSEPCCHFPVSWLLDLLLVNYCKLNCPCKILLLSSPIILVLLLLLAAAIRRPRVIVSISMPLSLFPMLPINRSLYCLRHSIKLTMCVLQRQSNRRTSSLSMMFLPLEKRSSPFMKKSKKSRIFCTRMCHL